MRLCSVQEVKAEIAAKLTPTWVKDVNQPAKLMSPVGLGFAKRGTENILAVRFYDNFSYWRNKFSWFQSLTRGELDVRFVGPIAVDHPDTSIWYQNRVRPLKIGSSIGHFKVTAGTLGCFVKRGSTTYILSNNHVIANQNDAAEGDAITQPGSYDGGVLEKDTVAKLSKFVPIEDYDNEVDAAIAALNTSESFDSTYLFGLGKLNGVYQGEVQPGDLVAKFGRTTGTTLGRVTAVEVDNVSVGYSDGIKTFNRQIEIEGLETGPFCRGGDSGSMVVSAPDGRDGEHHALGLLFAGGTRGGQNGQGLTYVNYFQPVLQKLEVQLLC